MNWFPFGCLHLWMVATLVGLLVTVVASALVTGVVASLFLLPVLALVTDLGGFPPGRATLWTVGATATIVVGVVIWGERKAPAHAVAAVGGRPVDDRERPELLAVVRSVSQRAGVPTPTVHVTPAETPLSLVTGFTPGSSRLVLSEGLLETLDGEGLEAVVAHELAHVRNRDAAVMTVATFPVAAAERVLELLSGPTTGVEHGHPSRADYADALVTAGLVFVFPIAVGARYLMAAFSRTREFAADRGAVAITGNPAALAGALERIDATLADRPSIDFRRAEVAAFAIVEPDGDEPFGLLAPIHRLKRRIFATHPDTARRVDRLRRIEREQERR